MSSTFAPNILELDLEIYQGATFEFPVRWIDTKTDEAIPLTGASAEFEIRDKVGGELLYRATSNDDITIEEADGIVRLKIPPQTTSEFEFKRGVYGMLLTRPGGSRVDPVARGAVALRRAVIQSP